MSQRNELTVMHVSKPETRHEYTHNVVVSTARPMSMVRTRCEHHNYAYIDAERSVRKPITAYRAYTSKRIRDTYNTSTVYR